MDLDVAAHVRSLLGNDAVVDGLAPDAGRFQPVAGPALRPVVTARPACTRDVQELVRWAIGTRTALVPLSSGGPHLHGGTVPSVGGAVLVDLRRMNRILKVNRRNRLALIEPGVTFPQLVPALAREGLQVALPLLPRATKSVIASLLDREPLVSPRFQWNPMEPLRSLEIVWGDGEKLWSGGGAFRGEEESDWTGGKVPAVGGGPAQIDYYRLLSGSQGCLGIATWASVRCEPVQEPRALWFAGTTELDTLLELVYELLRMRFADELFLANSDCLADLIVRGHAERKARAERLAPWYAVIGAGGGPVLGSQKLAVRENDIRDMARRHGIQLTQEIDGCPAGHMLRLLSEPGGGPYWKEHEGRSSREIFFLTMLEQAPRFIETMRAACAEHGNPSDGLGIYLQPMHQGVTCHCEFILPFDPGRDGQEQRVGALHRSASRALFRQGAFFSRPYGTWASMVYDADPATTEATRKVKDIFDPRHIMNPGKLCF
jgi:FAD/FMN-containing dehydrogenase